jgi:hypothetical protein
MIGSPRLPRWGAVVILLVTDSAVSFYSTVLRFAANAFLKLAERMSDLGGAAWGSKVVAIETEKRGAPAG